MGLYYGFKSMPFNHLWPLQRVCLEGVKSSPSQEACFCSPDCGEIKSFGQAENSALSSFPSNFQISMERMWMFFFFFCNPLMQSSVIVEITAGLLSGTTARGGSEEGPVLTGVEP